MTSTSSAPRRLDRLSSVSSASQASYHSAVSSSSPPPIVNPIHSLAHAQDLHIIKVTDDQVTYRSSTPSPPLLSKALHKISPLAGRDRSPSEDVLVTADANPIGTGNEEDDGRPREDSDMYASSAAAASAAGPPPPSPPASEGGHVPLLTDSPERVSSLRPLPPSLKSSTIPDSPGLTFTLPNPPPRTSSAAYLSSSAPLPTSHLSRALSDGIARQPPSPTLAQSLASSSSHIRHPTAPATDDPERASGGRHLARWNTVGGSSPRERARSYSGLDDLDVSAGLAGDIEQQAELLRRERNSKRRVEAEKASSSGSAAAAAAAVAVGNVIGEGHANYVLMYNMLTGIRIAVSRYQAKIKRALTEEDFTARHKYSFDIVGNELTPSAKYDFKFKDYAPWVFRELREDYFSLDPADYLLSLTAKYILSELGSPGKSGSFFYFSRDYRFIIKTIHHSEHKFLRAVLPRYHAHVKSNPHTLLSRFYGLHRVKLPRGRKIHFVIMNNLFPAHKDIHETYDLKGSTVGRLYPEHRARDNPRAVLKDLNWISRSKSLELGPEKRALLTEQLRRDADFLRELGVMDYSLLVGIHNLQRGNRDNVRRRTLKVFSPAVPAPALNRTPTALAVRRAMRASDLQRLGVHTGTDLPDEDTRDRARADVLFYRDEGGLRATDERNRPMDTVYYLGVIDILTPYTTKKRMEHFWKGLKADRHKISPVPPAEYAARFFAFMKAVMRGGGGGASFVSSSEMQRTAAAGIVDPSSSSAHTRTSSSNHPNNASNPTANEGVTPISPAYTDKMPESASSPDRPADLPIQTAGMEWAPAGRMSSAPVDRAAFGDGEKGGDERSRLLGGGGGGHGMDAGVGVNGSANMRPEYGARWSAPVGVRS